MSSLDSILQNAPAIIAILAAIVSVTVAFSKLENKVKLLENKIDSLQKEVKAYDTSFNESKSSFNKLNDSSLKKFNTLCYLTDSLSMSFRQMGKLHELPPKKGSNHPPEIMFCMDKQFVEISGKLDAYLKDLSYGLNYFSQPIQSYNSLLGSGFLERSE